MHWADQYAEQIVKKSPGKGEYVVESGITPSGIVHAGNFREVMSQEFVYKALLKKGVKARYQYVWDDFDRFRKVPKGISAEWGQYIGMPVSKTPDPWGCHESYSEHFASKLVEENEKCGVHASYVKMSEQYGKCEFAEEMKTALEKKGVIKGILDDYRKEPYPEDWMPVRVYCKKCWKDTTTVEYLGDYSLKYTCECGGSGEFDFREKGLAKMPWRVCWAQRWKHYGVDFESSGKDHHAAGGSWDTGTRISLEVFGHDPPIGPMYEFIYAKGQKEKMSSSEGNVFTVSDLLEVYEPEIVRYIYTAKINHAIEVPFDMGVLNYYSYYDKVERVYFGKEKVDTEREKENAEAIYGLSQIGSPVERVQPPFGFCASITQIAGDLGQAIGIMQRTGHLPKALTPEDQARVELRLKLAKSWVEKYAPEEVKVNVLEEMPAVELSDRQKKALAMVAAEVENAKSADGLAERIKAVTEELGMQPKELFEAGYLVLLGKKRGPRLAPFLLSLDKEFVAKRLRLEG
ncbi:MAG: lysine--tRNA ligase [Candidatus Diapherotrites archaeon]|nr:lysine--tRNA ligase [Candidatus Diapherotrites archaeon]